MGIEDLSPKRLGHYALRVDINKPGFGIEADCLIRMEVQLRKYENDSIYELVPIQDWDQ